MAWKIIRIYDFCDMQRMQNRFYDFLDNIVKLGKGPHGDGE